MRGDPPILQWPEVPAHVHEEPTFEAHIEPITTPREHHGIGYVHVCNGCHEFLMAVVTRFRAGAPHTRIYGPVWERFAEWIGPAVEEACHRRLHLDRLLR